MSTMEMEQALLEKWRTLPEDKQEAALKFVESLHGNGEQAERFKRPRRSLAGLWADLNIEITDEDIAEARREMWGNFPRDIDL